MNRFRLLFGAVSILLAVGVGAQEAQGPPSTRLEADLEPLELGFRYDDNVYQLTVANDRLSDGIYSLDGGAHLRAWYDIFKARLDYHLGADQYLAYSTLNNFKNDFDLWLEADPGDFNLYYRKDYFVRNSDYSEFNYLDDDNLLGVQWNPSGPWSYEAKFKSFSRYYYDESNDTIRTQNFVDQGGLLGVQREFGDKFAVKMEGSYNNRQFDRYAIDANGNLLPGDPLQMDETWTGVLNARVYFESILQDVTFQAARTHSNTPGFSNTVESVSWAAVVRPTASLYLQLLFRLFSKTYDTPPPSGPKQYIGFIDEDSQDLLSVKASWDLSPQWSASLSASRMRNEYIQAGEYYIKNILAAQLKRTF